MAVYEDLERLYAWIDAIPLSRFKKNLPRDFSDGGKCLIMHFQVILGILILLKCIVV